MNALVFDWCDGKRSTIEEAMRRPFKQFIDLTWASKQVTDELLGPNNLEWDEEFHRRNNSIDGMGWAEVFAIDASFAAAEEAARQKAVDKEDAAAGGENAGEEETVRRKIKTGGKGAVDGEDTAVGGRNAGEEQIVGTEGQAGDTVCGEDADDNTGASEKRITARKRRQKDFT